VKTWRIVVAQLVAIVAIYLMLGWRGLIAYAAVVLVAILYRHHILKVLGGFSGDTVGAYTEISQVVFLLAYLIVVRATL